LNVIQQKVEAPEHPDIVNGEDIRVNVLEKVLASLDGVFFAIKQGLTQPYDEVSLIAEIDDLHRRIARIRYAPRLRPWRNVLKFAEALLEGIEEGASHYLRAGIADTPIEAQRLAEKGQERLDCAAESIEPLVDALEIYSPDLTTSQDYISQLGRTLQATLGSRDLLALDEIGGTQVRAVLGKEVNLHRGLGVQALVTLEQAKALLDCEKFLKIFVSTYHGLIGRTVRLDALLADARLGEDLQDAADALNTGILTAYTMATIRSPDHAKISAVFDLGRSIVEGPGRRLAAALMSVSAKKPYETYRNMYSSSLLNMHEAGKFRESFAALDSTLRDASAHQTFRIENGFIAIGVEHVRHLTVEELVDKVLSHAEAVFASYLALTVAASTRGIQLTDPRGAGALGLSGAEAIEFALTLWGWSVQAIEVRNQTLLIVADVELDTRVLLSLIVACSVRGELEFERIEASLSCNGLDTFIRGPVLNSPVSNYDQDEARHYYVRLASSFSADEKPLMPPILMRAWAALVVGNSVSKGYRECVAPIKRLRNTAQTLSDRELDTALRRCLTALRCSEDGLLVEDEERGAISWVKGLLLPFSGVSEQEIEALLHDDLLSIRLRLENLY